MANKLPFQITPGVASRGSVVHASDAAVSDLSRSHPEESISRLQSAANTYSSLLTYDVGDLIVQSNVVYRCTTQILVPEAFNITNWAVVSQTPWISDIDASQFTLSNIPAIQMANDGIVDIEMYRNTNPGSTGLISQIDFDQRKTSGAKATFGSIRMLTNDAVAGTVNSEMQFQARVNDSLTIFMAINETDTDSIRCFKPVNIHQTNLTFDDTLSTPLGTTKTIYLSSNAMVFNVPSSRGFEWSINDTDWMTIDSTVGIAIGTITSQPLGFYGTTPVAQQTVASDTLAELYIAIRALGLIA